MILMDNLSLTPLYNKVMIIDDNEIDLYIAEKSIRNASFAKEVILKQSVREALDYLTLWENSPEELPQLIFTDIRMPEMDGFAFLGEYEKLPEIVRKKCIVMMLSSSLNNDDFSRAKENPFVQQFLNKPLNKEKLESIRQKGLKAA
jgi:CheY-like chemotaxis protein